MSLKLKLILAGFASVSLTAFAFSRASNNPKVFEELEKLAKAGRPETQRIALDAETFAEKIGVNTTCEVEISRRPQSAFAKLLKPSTGKIKAEVDLAVLRKTSPEIRKSFEDQFNKMFRMTLFSSPFRCVDATVEEPALCLKPTIDHKTFLSPTFVDSFKALLQDLETQLKVFTTDVCLAKLEEAKKSAEDSDRYNDGTFAYYYDYSGQSEWSEVAWTSSEPGKKYSADEYVDRIEADPKAIYDLSAIEFWNRGSSEGTPPVGRPGNPLAWGSRRKTPGTHL